MKIEEKVTIERLPSGLYAISRKDQPTLIGGAASTIVALSSIVFIDEASEIPSYIRNKVA